MANTSEDNPDGEEPTNMEVSFEAVAAVPPVEEEDAEATSASRKRTASDLQEQVEADAAVPQDGAVEEEQDPAKKRQRTGRSKNVPPPKKLNNEQWDAMYLRLIDYKQQHGDCLVPKRYASDPKLGTWVETQRVQYKKLQRASTDATDAAVTPNKRLNAERLERLEAIGFAWSAKNLRKPKQTTPASSSKKKSPVASAADAVSRAAARNRLNQVQWNDMYERLVKYKENHGDCLVPKKYEEDPKLATWVETQRVLHNRDYRKASDPQTVVVEAPVAAVASIEGKSPEEWAEELEGGPAETATAEDVAAVVAATMEAATMEVVDAVTNDAAVTEAALDADDAKPAAVETPVDPVAEATLESGIVATTTAGKPVKRLTEERKAKLEELGFVWSLRSKRVDDHWDEMFVRLVRYKEQHGDCLVPSRYEEDVKLGKWVETQRYEYTKLQRASEGFAEAAKAGERADDKVGDTGTPKTPRPTNPRLTEERLRRLESIGFEWKVKHKMKRYYDRQWDAMYERLLEYKKEHGHCLVPKRYPPDMKLGTWVHTQRIQYRKFLAGTSKKENASEHASESADAGTDDAKGEEETSFRLTEDRRRRLEDAGFVWSARETEKSNETSRITRNSYDDQWDAMFERLVTYKEKHGNCLVPKRCKEDPKLGTWVDTQRVQYKKMRKQLAKMGIEWTGPPPEAEKEGGGDESKEGDAPPNTAPKPIVGRLTDDRIRRLEALGFVWSLRDDWQKHYDELIEYKKEHGHCNVPARYQKNRRLGIWVSAQRQQFKIMNMTDDLKPRRSAPLTAERVQLLNQLGFTWTIRSRDSLGESWNQRLAELRQFKAEIGHCLVPSRYPPNPELGVWVGTQRTQYRLYMKAKENNRSLAQSSAMNAERIRQLEELGFAWALRGNADEKTWRKRMSELVEYRNAHGNLYIPKNYHGIPGLGAWVDFQRLHYQLMREGKQSMLDPEKVAELDSVGFDWSVPAEEPPHHDVALADARDTAATAAALVAAVGPIDLGASSAPTNNDMQQGAPVDMHVSPGAQGSATVQAPASVGNEAASSGVAEALDESIEI